MDGFIDGTKLTLRQFLDILMSEKWHRVHPSNQFPTDDLLNEFLKGIHLYTDREVKLVLQRFIIKNSTLGIDILYKQAYSNIDWAQREAGKGINERFSETQYFKRLMSYRNQHDTVWEGLTWVIDLLPHFPNEALKALDAYFLSNCQFLSDSYLTAFGDWSAIIRSKYIHATVPKEIFLNFTPIEFEYLIAELYTKMGYDALLTKASHDGGVDVVATKMSPGEKEKILVQCKKYRGGIGVDEARKLLGVVSDQKANKGVLITTSIFTKPAIKFAKSNPRIELIDVAALTQLLNQFLGAMWPVKTDQYLLHQKQKEVSSKLPPNNKVEI